jgi:hypothetical protein
MGKYSMKLTPERAVMLIAQLDKEYRVFEDNCRLNRKAWERIEQGARDELDWAALGYTLHMLYTTMENYFLRISKTFENNLPSDTWHRHLIEAMQLDLPGIRPAFMDSELAEITDELRGFRHVFRSVYENRIDPDRVSLLQKKIPRMQNLFFAAHRSYCKTVSELAVSP